MGRYQQQKNIISPQNIQLIEQIGEGEFGTGKIAHRPERELIHYSSF
jgi:hypothetical protein